ncbi:hypothetical protein MASR2M44_07150 [Bacteroidota bacterium]
MQELPLVALPPQQPQHFQAVGYPLLSLSRNKETTLAMAFGDGFGCVNDYQSMAIGY